MISGFRTKKDFEIHTSFSRSFSFENICKYQANIKFHCPNRMNCNVTFDEPCYTPFIGSPNTKVMVIGEAPSTANSHGAYCGGLFSEVEKNMGEISIKKSRVDWIRDFVKTEFGCIPYFTDLSKCGLSNQGNKSKLEKRFSICYEYFLKHEIEIINPEVILFVGLNLEEKIGNKIKGAAKKIESLYHYSKNNCAVHKNNRDIMFSKWREQLR